MKDVYYHMKRCVCACDAIDMSLLIRQTCQHRDAMYKSHIWQDSTTCLKVARYNTFLWYMIKYIYASVPTYHSHSSFSSWHILIKVFSLIILHLTLFRLITGSAYLANIHLRRVKQLQPDYPYIDPLLDYLDYCEMQRAAKLTSETFEVREKDSQRKLFW